MTDQVSENEISEGQVWDDPDPQEFARFVSTLDLAQIEVAKMSANRVAAGESVETNFETRLGFMIGPEALHWRFDCAATVLDAEGDTLGLIDVSVIVSAKHSGKTEPTPEVLAKFGETSASFMATPFLRETIATCAQRIGLPNVLLPMLKRAGD